MSDLPAPQEPKRGIWRIVFLVLLLIPALPALLLFATGVTGLALGCDPASDRLCYLGSISLGSAADYFLTLSGGFAIGFGFIGGLWLLLSLFPIRRAFTNAGLQLLAAAFMAGWALIAPLFLALWALSPIMHGGCRLNEGAVGNCPLFGIATTGGHQLAGAIWVLILGMPVAAAVFIAFAIFVAVRAGRGKQKTLAFPPRT
jgi:hypothetical protein